MSAPSIGRFRLYASGNDEWMYQRFAYRIVMQGYWLEGGSPTFWFQPLYRWIVGRLARGIRRFEHWRIVLGRCLSADDSLVRSTWSKLSPGSAGASSRRLPPCRSSHWERRRFAGHGLSEISSAGLMYLAAFFALRSANGHRGSARGRRAGRAWLLHPIEQSADGVRRCRFARPPCTRSGGAATAPRLSRVSWRTVAGVCATLCLGLLRSPGARGITPACSACCTARRLIWLSVWQPGLRSVTLKRVAGSVMMVLTMNDPPRWDWHAGPLLTGAIISVLAVTGVPGSARASARSRSCFCCGPFRLAHRTRVRVPGSIFDSCDCRDEHGCRLCGRPTTPYPLIHLPRS